MFSCARQQLRIVEVEWEPVKTKEASVEQTSVTSPLKNMKISHF
jgi:hypothetical protein